jgi:E3 ubiquitin-protein ligase UBR4
MWSIWPELPAYGRKAAQFVDLLGYFSLKTAQTEKKVKEKPLPPLSIPCVESFE